MMTLFPEENEAFDRIKVLEYLITKNPNLYCIKAIPIIGKKNTLKKIILGNLKIDWGEAGTNLMDQGYNCYFKATINNTIIKIEEFHDGEIFLNGSLVFTWGENDMAGKPLEKKIRAGIAKSIDENFYQLNL